jgi:MFS family permease
LQNILLLTPVQFGWCAVIIGAFSFSGAYLNSILVTKYGVLKMLKIGVLLLFCAGLVMLIPVSFNKLTITSIMLPAAIAAFGVSLIIPNAYAAGLIGCSDFVGIAVAILSFLQIMGGVLSSLIISITLGNNQVPLGLVFLISGILGIIIMFFLQKINSSL